MYHHPRSPARRHPSFAVDPVPEVHPTPVPLIPDTYLRAGAATRARPFRRPRLGALLAGAALACLAVACGPAGDAPVREVRVAVASNFREAHEALAERFERESGYRVVSSTGSTGQLYAQIRNGAPAHLFLAADAERPRLLEEAGLAVPGTRFAYASGRLVLFGPGLDSVRAGGADLAEGRFTHLAIANPRTAPYGAAAEEVVRSIWTRRLPHHRVVQGENIAQTFAFVRSGAAELGLVALSQVLGEPARSYWLVPEELHSPIEQEAVLLAAGEGNVAAAAFLAFLRTPAARGVMLEFGYQPAASAE
jgi:molybdate transport system substrate-binding protein